MTEGGTPQQAVNPATVAVVMAYERVFGTEDGQVVLEDLRRALGVEWSTEKTPHQVGLAAAFWKIQARLKTAELVKAGAIPVRSSE